MVEVRSGRYPEERDALVAVGEEQDPSIHVKHFTGRPAERAPPWIEAALPGDDERFATEVVVALAAMLPPGGHLMLVYGDDETERGLKRGFPAAATPLGRALVSAGCTWFKDWYFAEGGREGEAKLQGNKPIGADARRAQVERLEAELRAWLEREPARGDDLLARATARARAIVERS